MLPSHVAGYNFLQACCSFLARPRVCLCYAGDRAPTEVVPQVKSATYVHLVGNAHPSSTIQWSPRDVLSRMLCHPSQNWLRWIAKQWPYFGDAFIQEAYFYMKRTAVPKGIESLTPCNGNRDRSTRKKLGERPKEGESGAGAR